MTYQGEPRERDYDRTIPRADELPDDGTFEIPRLGHDIRFIFAAVGGGAIRIGQEVARHHLPYVESVAINCDSAVQEAEEFDRRICLGPDSGAPADTEGSPAHGAHLAREAQPALERIFEGATFVTVLGSLGGGSGTGALPVVLESASRASRVISVFVVKPFRCEGDRRAIADRALGRLHFIESFVEKQERRTGRLQVLDNDSLLAKGRTMPFRDVNRHWAGVIASHIERNYIAPAEAALDDFRITYPVPAVPIVRTAPIEPDHRVPVPDPEHVVPIAPHVAWAADEPRFRDVEVTFEIDGGPKGPSVG
jgi:hypothetical protein